MSDIVSVAFYTGNNKSYPIQTIAISGFEIEEVDALAEEYKTKSPSLQEIKNLKHYIVEEASEEDA